MPFHSRSIKPALLSNFRTCCSNVATLLRLMPNTSKKPSQKLLASASSLVSCSHSLLKVTARDLISFQDRGIEIQSGGKGTNENRLGVVIHIQVILSAVNSNPSFPL